MTAGGKAEAMKHTAEEVTCPIINEQGNYHFEMVCEDCDIKYRLACATLGEAESLHRWGRITQDEYEGYCLAFELLSPYRNPDLVRIPDFPAVRRIARKLMRAKGYSIPARLQAGSHLNMSDPRRDGVGEKPKRAARRRR